MIRFAWCVFLALPGCAAFEAGPGGISGEGEITDRETEFYRAQATAHAAAAQAAMAPVFEMEAAPGEQLQIRGISRIAIRSGNGGQQAQPVTQYRNIYGEALLELGKIGLGLGIPAITAVEMAKNAGETLTNVAGIVSDTARDVTVVEQPAPVQIPPAPPPQVVEQPPPIIVEQPPPIIVEQPPPIIVEQPGPPAGEF